MSLETSTLPGSLNRSQPLSPGPDTWYKWVVLLKWNPFHREMSGYVQNLEVSPLSAINGWQCRQHSYIGNEYLHLEVHGVVGDVPYCNWIRTGTWKKKDTDFTWSTDDKQNNLPSLLSG